MSGNCEKIRLRRRPPAVSLSLSLLSTDASGSGFSHARVSEGKWLGDAACECMRSIVDFLFEQLCVVSPSARNEGRQPRVVLLLQAPSCRPWGATTVVQEHCPFGREEGWRAAQPLGRAQGGRGVPDDQAGQGVPRWVAKTHQGRGQAHYVDAPQAPPPRTWRHCLGVAQSFALGLEAQGFASRPSQSTRSEGLPT